MTHWRKTGGNASGSTALPPSMRGDTPLAANAIHLQTLAPVHPIAGTGQLEGRLPDAGCYGEVRASFRNDEEFAARGFGIACCLSPLVIFGICYGIVKVFA